MTGRGLPYEQLAAEVAGGRLRPVYLLAGPDAFQQRAVLDALRAACAPQGKRDAVEVALSADGATPADVVAAARTPSLLGRRLVVVSDVPWFAAPRGGDAAADADEEAPAGRRRRGGSDPTAPLAAYLEAPAPDAVVVFRSPLPPDGRRRLVRRLGEVGAVLAALPPPPEALPAWCSQRAAVHGLRLTPSAAAALCARVPPSLDLLDQELAKLAAFVGGGVAGPDDVARLVAPSREERVFALLDAAAEGRPRDAFAHLATLRAQGEEPLGLLALLARQVRLLAQALDAGGGAERLAAATALPPYVVRRLLSQARRWSAARLAAALIALWEAERAIKTGRLSDDAALTLALGTLAAGQEGGTAEPR
jgi:DNA polymerase-3 subunit delta